MEKAPWMELWLAARAHGAPDQFDTLAPTFSESFEKMIQEASRRGLGWAEDLREDPMFGWTEASNMLTEGLNTLLVRLLSPENRVAVFSLSVESASEEALDLDIPYALFECGKVFADSLSGEDEGLRIQQAANILNVSWQYMARLLDEGRVPHYMKDNNRRVREADLLAFKRQRDQERREGLRELTQMSEEFGGSGFWEEFSTAYEEKFSSKIGENPAHTILWAGDGFPSTSPSPSGFPEVAVYLVNSNSDFSWSAVVSASGVVWTKVSPIPVEGIRESDVTISSNYDDPYSVIDETIIS